MTSKGWYHLDELVAYYKQRNPKADINESRVLEDLINEEYAKIVEWLDASKNSEAPRSLGTAFRTPKS